MEFKFTLMNNTVINSIRYVIHNAILVPISITIFTFFKKKSVSMVPFMTKRAKMVWFSMVATELYTIFAIIIGPLIAENVYMTIPPFHPQDVFTNMASTPWESVVKQHFIR